MIQFYSPDIEKTLTLPESESGHCCRVLRKVAGDEIVVTDGKGNRYVCEIVNPNPKQTEVVIKSKEILDPERNYKLTLAVASTKNSDRMEWMVEKAVEIGVDRIVLLKCERSERKSLKSDRLLRVMISAMKQSLSGHLPELVETTDFETFIKEEPKGSQRYFGYCSPDYSKKEFAKECSPGGEVVVVIGPEGDFTPREVELAVKEGFEPVTFGQKRLRTETAGVFAVCAAGVINQKG